MTTAELILIGLRREHHCPSCSGSRVEETEERPFDRLRSLLWYRGDLADDRIPRADGCLDDDGGAA